MNDWFRSWHGAPTDPKWRTIARRANVSPGDVSAVVWLLLDRASQATDRGSVAGYDAEVIADALGYEADEVERIMSALVDKGVIQDNRFTAWNNRQPKREDNSAKRTKEYRERKAATGDDPPAPVTPGDAPVTPGDARLDKTRGEKKEKKDTPSLREGVPPERQAIESYNKVATELKWPIARLTETRKRSIKLRLAEAGGITGWENAMARARASPFLRGESGRQSGHENWRPDLDFFLQPKSFTKLIEGSYDATDNAKPKPHDTILRALAKTVAKRTGNGGWPPGANGGEPDPAGPDDPVTLDLSATPVEAETGSG